MAKFWYTAKNQSGETRGGEMIAPDEKALAKQLRSEGYILTSVKEIEGERKAVSVKFLDRFKKVSLKEKMMFTRNLAVMVASGVSITRAMNNLALQTKDKTFQNILKDIRSELESGKQLSEGLAKYPGTFGDLFVNMVRVGEVGGNLDEVLAIVATQLEKEHDLTSKVRGALIYPAVVLTAMVGIAILMLTYVLPQIMGVFKDMAVTLPASTQFIVNISDFLRAHAITSTVIMVAFVVGVRLALGTKIGKRIMSLVLIKMPLISGLVIKINCARFARILSSLLKSGVSVIDALRIIGETLTNYYYRQELIGSIEEVKKGLPLSKVIYRNPKIFPILIPQMLEVGEETGETEKVMLKLAEFYEDEVNNITKNMSSIVEPILMLLIGGAVGFFAVAMMQPMYSVMQNIQ